MNVEQHRYVTLDAMRGLAAVIIMVGHAVSLTGDASDYLAVDFFFVLSGFVIARAYDERLGAGMTPFEFMKTRAIRLFPLLLLGLAFGALRGLRITLMAGPDALSPSAFSISVLFGLFALPSPADFHAFPINPPSWSLFFELAVNVVYALWIVRAGTVRLTTMVVLFGALLVYVAIRHGSLNGGYLWGSLHVGAARVLFGFSLGVLIARVHRLPTQRSWAAFVSMVALVVILVMPIPPGLRVVFDLCAAMLLTPALVWSGASFNPPARFDRIAQTLGLLSYPIYAIHFPIVNVMASVANSHHVPLVAWLPVAILTITLIAALAVRYIDTPTRRWLARRATLRGSLVL